MHSHNYK